MASTSSLTLIFLISYLTLLASSKEQKPQKNCPPTFQCGSLGPIGYPFTTIFNPNCGIIVINCTVPLTIGLSAIGPWYDVIYTLSNNRSFLIGDKLFQNLVNDDKCTSMANSSFNFPKSSTVTFTSLNNETFWKCGKNFSKSRDVDFHAIIECTDFDVYNSNRSSLESSNLSNCTVFRYPQFIMVELSEKCSRCINEGGYCHDLESYKFQCINKRKERTILRLLLALGIPGGSIGITVCALLFWYIRKIKLRSLAMASEKVSKHPMRMKTDIEKSKVYFSIPVFSYTELEEATNNFSPTRELGDGGFGTVYYGKLKDGREVAVKRLYERNYKQLECYMNEIEILACLRHQNLVTLYGCTSRQSQELLLVYEYLPNSTVADHLFGDQSKCGTLTWPIRMRIAIETATALSYLHASDIIHRDVKTRNILLDHNFSVKVADFGLSRLFPMEVTHISTAPQGTPGYLDPEYHQCYQLTDKSDVYSFGVVLIELISSLPAIDIGRKEDEINLSNYAMKRIQCCVFDELVDQRVGFYSNSDIQRKMILVAELAFQCLQHKKDFRPSMGEVLESLKKINSGEYGVYKVVEKEDNDVWLLRNTESPSSPISVMETWNTPKESR